MKKTYNYYDKMTSEIKDYIMKNQDLVDFIMENGYDMADVFYHRISDDDDLRYSEESFGYVINNLDLCKATGNTFDPEWSFEDYDTADAMIRGSILSKCLRRALEELYPGY